MTCLSFVHETIWENKHIKNRNIVEVDNIYPTITKEPAREISVLIAYAQNPHLNADADVSRGLNIG